MGKPLAYPSMVAIVNWNRYYDGVLVCSLQSEGNLTSWLAFLIAEPHVRTMNILRPVGMLDLLRQSSQPYSTIWK